MPGREGVAAAALTLRWGSYLAVLLDCDKPLWPGVTGCLVLAREQSRRPWSEQVLPYGLAKMMLITPYQWTLTESSGDVQLPAWLRY